VSYFNFGVLWGNFINHALSAEINIRTTFHDFNPQVLVDIDGSSLTGINFECNHPVVYKRMGKYSFCLVFRSPSIDLLPMKGSFLFGCPALYVSLLM
jgi:hypothetical protein